MPRTDVVTAVTTPADHPRLAGVRTWRSNCIADEDITVRPDGIRVAAPPRLWFDLAAFLRPDPFESVTEQVLDQHCGMPLLWRTLRRLGGRGRKGSALAQLVLSRRPEWQRPADSDLEFRVLRALEHRGLELVRQYPLRLRNGHWIHLDGADPDRRFGLEVDHHTWHGGRFERERDAARDRAAQLLGWTVHRVTDVQLTAAFDHEIDVILDRHAASA